MQAVADHRQPLAQPLPLKTGRSARYPPLRFVTEWVPCCYTTDVERVVSPVCSAKEAASFILKSEECASSVYDASLGVLLIAVVATTTISVTAILAVAMRH